MRGFLHCFSSAFKTRLFLSVTCFSAQLRLQGRSLRRTWGRTRSSASQVPRPPRESPPSCSSGMYEYTLPTFQRPRSRSQKVVQKINSLFYLRARTCDLEVDIKKSCSYFQATYVLILLGWLFVPIYVASGVSLTLYNVRVCIHGCF